MNQEEQNSIDLERMNRKRGHAYKLLDQFKSWHQQSSGSMKVDDQIVFMGLRRDIRSGTESEVDYLIGKFDEYNQKALLKKLEQ